MEDVKIQFKVCTKCGESKSLDEFSPSKGGKFGVASRCKICRCAIANEAYAKNPEIRDSKREWAANNPDKVKAIANEWYKNNKYKVKTYQKTKYASDPEFKIIKSLRNATHRLFKGGGKSKKTLYILGVKSFEEAKARLLETMPVGYTLQDYLDVVVVIDHKIPLAWWDLTIESELMKAGNMTNLQLLTNEANKEKGDRYGHMPDNSIILYEDWIATKSLPNVEDNGVISKENGISIEQFSTVSHILPHSPTF